jgi:hypothetical protein
MTDPKQAADDGFPPEVAALHPFVLTAFSVLVPGTDGERFAFPEEQVHDLHSGLLQFDGEEELAHIVHGLTAMAVTMKDSLNSPSVANQLIAILEDEAVRKVLLKLKIAQDPEALNAAAMAFESFAGSSGNKQAPMANEPRPEGTLTLDAMKFPKRL